MTVFRQTGRQPGLMVWGDISFRSGTPVVIIRGNLTAMQYVHEVLRPVVLSFISRHPWLIFKQDNARPHTAQVSTVCLSVCQALHWPVRSLYLSLIEHIWSAIGRAIQQAQDVDHLTRQLVRIWHDIPKEDILNLYQSMPSRIIACIRAIDE